MPLLFAIVLLFLLLIVGFILTAILYNRFTRSRVKVQESFSSITVYLRQRNALIAHLADIVRNYTEPKNPIIIKIIEQCNNMPGTTNMAYENTALNTLNKNLPYLVRIAALHPEIATRSDYKDITQRLTGLDADLNHLRRYYNRTVGSYNKTIAVFPGKIIANLFRFRPEAFFNEHSTTMYTAIDPVQVNS